MKTSMGKKRKKQKDKKIPQGNEMKQEREAVRQQAVSTGRLFCA